MPEAPPREQRIRRASAELPWRAQHRAGCGVNLPSLFSFAPALQGVDSHQEATLLFTIDLPAVLGARRTDDDDNPNRVGSGRVTQELAAVVRARRLQRCSMPIGSCVSRVGAPEVFEFRRAKQASLARQMETAMTA
jgi:hypothetical protein